jgi:hypothetical protein
MVPFSSINVVVWSCLESAKEHPVNSEENRTGEIAHASARFSDWQPTESNKTSKNKDANQGSQAFAA